MNKTTTIGLTTMAAFAALAVAAIATPAQAWQTGQSERAYCLNSPGDHGIGRICSFDSLAQCQATLRGINGSCDVNPWYAYNDAPRYAAPRRQRY